APRTLLLTGLLFGVVAGAPPAGAQRVREIGKVGFLGPNPQAGAAHLVEAFRQGLRALGHAEGKTLVLEIRYADGKSERLPDLARELVGLRPDVIVSATDPATAAL